MADVVEVMLRVSANQAKGQVRELGQAAATTKRQVDGLDRSLDAAGDEARRLGRETRNAGNSTKGLGAAAAAGAVGLATMATGLLSAITLVAQAARAFADYTKAIIDASNELADASARSDVMVSTLAGLRLAAKGSGQEFNALSRGLNSLPKRIADAAAGVGDAAQGFSNLGVAVRDANGEVRDTDAVFRDVAQAITDGGAKGADVAKALGENFGPRLRQALAGSADGLEGFIEAADALGTTDATELTGELQRSFALLEEAALGAGARMLEAAGGDGGIATVVDGALRVIEGVTVAFQVFAEAMANQRRNLRRFGEAIVAWHETIKGLVLAVAESIATAVSNVVQSLVEIAGPAATVVGDVAVGIANGVASTFTGVLDAFAALAERMLSVLVATIEAALSALVTVAQRLGFEDEVESASRALEGLRRQVEQNKAIFDDLVDSTIEAELSPFTAVVEGFKAAIDLDTSAALDTLSGGRAGGLFDPSGGASGSGGLSNDARLFVAELTAALKEIDRADADALTSIFGAGFDLDRLLLEISQAKTDVDVAAIVNEIGATNLLQIEGFSDRLNEAGDLVSQFGETFSSTEQALAAQLLGVGDSAGSLNDALVAAALTSDAAFDTLTERAQQALEAADALVDAQQETVESFKDLSRQLDSAGRELFEAIAGTSFGDRQAEIARLQRVGTPEAIAQANALRATTNEQITSALAAQEFSAPFVRAAEVFEAAVGAFSIVTDAFGALLLGDVAGAVSAVTTGIGDAVQQVLPAVGSIIGTAVSPGIGTAIGQVVGQVAGAQIARRIESVSRVLGTLTQLGQIGAGGVAERLDEFSNNLIAGLEALPVVIEKVLPAFFAALRRELPPVLISTARELARILGRGFANFVDRLPFFILWGMSQALELAINALLRGITGLVNAALGTDFDAPTVDTPDLRRSSGTGEGASGLGRALGAGAGLLFGGPVGAIVGAFAGDRVGNLVDNADLGALRNSRGFGGLNLTLNGVVSSDRDDLARFLQDLFDGDRRFGLSLGGN